MVVLMASSHCGAQTGKPHLVEVGPEINQIYLPVDPVGSVTYEPGVGATGALNISRYFGLDGAISITPNAANTKTSFAGGHLTQLALGARAGFTWHRVRIYGKLRPGAANFSNVITRVNPGPPVAFQFGRLTAFSLDAGAIMQIDLLKRFSLRYEAGDTMIRYPQRTVVVGLPPSPPETTHNFEFGIGFMFHFR
jgi:hypothetical protein